MKNKQRTILSLFCFLGLFCSKISAQINDIPDPTLAKQPRIIVQTGVGTQWFTDDGTYRSWLLSIERPFFLYQHIGIQANFLFPSYGFVPSSTYYSYGQYLNVGSYEAGIFYKLFLHGRFTGRKSSLYIGPELKFGRRRYEDYYYDYSSYPYPINPTLIRVQERTSKVLLRLGAQYKLGPAVFEICLPIGIENSKFINLPLNYYTSSPGTRLTATPSVQMGIAF